MTLRNFEKSIELENDGRLSLFFIGTGSAFSKKYFQTNLLIIKGKSHILVDCGTTCSYALETIYHTGISEIKNLIITHQHADHIGGVEELMLIGKYGKRVKPNLIIQNELKKTLWNNSLSGGVRFCEFGKMKFNDYFTQIKPKLIQKKPFKIYEINYLGINLKLFRTLHVTTKPDSTKNSQFSQGLIIDNRILYTSDTQFNKEQIEYLNDKFNFEAIFHDCDVTGFSSGVHAPYKSLCTLKEEIKQKMWLCHYNDAKESVNEKADKFAGFAIPGIYYDFE